MRVLLLALFTALAWLWPVRSTSLFLKQEAKKNEEQNSSTDPVLVATIMPLSTPTERERIEQLQEEQVLLICML